MKDTAKTKRQLIDELVDLRQQVRQLEATKTELLEREKQLNMVLEGSNEGVWNWDLVTGTVQVSARWAELLGYRQDELELDQQTCEKLIPREDRALILKALDQCLLTGNSHCQVEHRLFTKSGLRWFLARGEVVARSKHGQVLRMIGTHIDITERRWAEEALQQRNCELALLNHATQAFNSTLDLDQVLVTVLAGVRYLLDVSACSVWLVDPETKELVCRQASGPHSEMVRGWRLAPGEGLAGWAVHHGRPMVVPDTRTDARYFKGVDERTGFEYRSILSIPLWVRQQVMGTLHVLDASVNRFKEIDVTLLESLAAIAATAIENARLYEQARQDAQAKSMLLHEVNHRVKNNLAAIIGLLFAEQHRSNIQPEADYQLALKKLIGRIQGLATVHHLLSSSEWMPLSLRELTTKIIASALQARPPDTRVMVEVSDDEACVTAEQASSLALILNELATNAVKYALAERQTARISVHISHNSESVLLEFCDDGPGYPAAVIRFEQYNAGLYLIRAIVSTNLQGELMLRNDYGAVTAIRFKCVAPDCGP